MITLVIMDGYGLSKKTKGNAIKLSKANYLEKLKPFCQFTTLNASGNCVGLPDGQMGNSEAGHLTIGAGRRFYQPLEKINRAIKDGSFFSNQELLKTMQYAKDHNSALHIIGLLSDGGIHSHINHIKATIKMANDFGLEKIYIHPILDGRDTEINSGINFLKDLELFLKDYNGKIKSICGRAWAMDRELHYERTEKYYNCIVYGKTETYDTSAVHACQESYNNNVFDEFVEPVFIGEKIGIDDYDSIIFCNIRKDRARQLLESLTKTNFDKFEISKMPHLSITGMVRYGDSFKTVGVAFPDEEITNCLAEVLSKNGKKQYHISETTKYAHVTYYFNGGRDVKFKNETHEIINGETDLDLAKFPKMKSFEITEKVLEVICDNKQDFIVVNYPNCDMIGHTAQMEATKEAVWAVEKNAYSVALATMMAGGTCIIIADHGNAEELLEKDGSPKTSHTTNPVPCYVISKHKQNFKLRKDGELANIAPTILELMGITPPKEMTNSLLIWNKKK